MPVRNRFTGIVSLSTVNRHRSGTPTLPRGYEKAYNHALIGNAGGNLLDESAGMVASLLGCSMEQLIIDNDIIGATQRTIRGIEISEGALSVESIRETCLVGPNHFRGSSLTLARMQKDYLYPLVGDRSSPEEWEEKGRPCTIDRANRKLQGILDSRYPSHIPSHIDDQIREAFPVRLPREAARMA